MLSSVTAENGSEFALHYRLANTVAVPTYFADQYRAWQRGPNEHFNGLIRKYRTKRSGFDAFDQRELGEIKNRTRERGAG